MSAGAAGEDVDSRGRTQVDPIPMTAMKKAYSQVSEISDQLENMNDTLFAREKRYGSGDADELVGGVLSRGPHGVHIPRKSGHRGAR